MRTLINYLTGSLVISSVNCPQLKKILSPPLLNCFHLNLSTEQIPGAVVGKVPSERNNGTRCWSNRKLRVPDVLAPTTFSALCFSVPSVTVEPMPDATSMALSDDADSQRSDSGLKIFKRAYRLLMAWAMSKRVRHSQYRFCSTIDLRGSSASAIVAQLRARFSNERPRVYSKMRTILIVLRNSFADAQEEQDLAALGLDDFRHNSVRGYWREARRDSFTATMQYPRVNNVLPTTSSIEAAASNVDAVENGIHEEEESKNKRVTLKHKSKVLRKNTGGGPGSGPDLIVDDGGDATLLIHESVKAKEEFAKTEKVPYPSLTDNAKFQIMLNIIKEGLSVDPLKYHKMKERLVGVSEETTIGVKRLYQMQANEEPVSPGRGDLINDNAPKKPINGATAGPISPGLIITGDLTNVNLSNGVDHQQIRPFIAGISDNNRYDGVLCYFINLLLSNKKWREGSDKGKLLSSCAPELCGIFVLLFTDGGGGRGGGGYGGDRRKDNYIDGGPDRNSHGGKPLSSILMMFTEPFDNCEQEKSFYCSPLWGIVLLYQTSLPADKVKPLTEFEYEGEKRIVHHDMWILKTWVWKKVKKCRMLPGPRDGFSMCVHKNRAVLFEEVMDMEAKGQHFLYSF
ncbi:S-adenosyl-L-homocysteine hydrolase [Tanacetum coccineum]